jgi:hypothetical protein
VLTRTTSPIETPGPKRQVTFYYRRFIASFAAIEPLSGPEFGGTTVSLRADYPFLNSMLVRCVFGNTLTDMNLV